jgi:oxygen-independent coproporphyrinogen-3 oxidase
MTKPISESALLKKYDVPVPRYTSYPTLPCWNTQDFTTEKWIQSVKKVFDETNRSKGISLYIHLPFCESLCTYCACNTRITKNHSVEINYIRSLLKEWEMYQSIFGDTPIIRELHLGGGTPTFFSAENLRWLISYLLEETVLRDEREFSFEGHPNNTSQKHLETLHDLGFSRVSFGVQDLDEKVQRTVNRIQPFENLERVTSQARSIGYDSISYDLIYGLPFQTPATVRNTFEKVLALRPDRVSFYSYAHVPWLRPGQRGYEDADLPSDVIKRELYETGRQVLKSDGYLDVGMDHFALPHDSLRKAYAKGKLHRNFMGYTTSETDLLIGLGCSAISDAKYAYAQNIKKVEDYASALSNNSLAVVKGHVQSEDDLYIKRCILAIACQGRIDSKLVDKCDQAVVEAIDAFIKEGILVRQDGGLLVSECGRAFIRNVCNVFDQRPIAQNNVPATVFSKSI